MAAKTIPAQAAYSSLKHKTLGTRIWEYRWIYLLGLPGMLVLLLFNYLPMRGLLMAFQDFNPQLGILGSEWVGFDHFIKLFKDPKFYLMLKNTLIVSGLSLLTFPAPIILALLMNELRNMKVKKAVQTAVYLPHFLSWTIVVSLTFFLLSTEQGVINKLISMAGGDTHAFLFDKNYIYLIIVVQTIWKSIGWNSIVYLAAISGIDQGLYEAAKIDGASKWQMIWRITLPCILPTVAVMLILKMGTIISVDFEQVFLMSNPLVKNQLEVFEVYIFNYGVAKGGTQFGYTTAIGLFKSAINTFLVILTNRIVASKGLKGVM